LVDTTVCTPQPTYVIVEQIYPKSGLPSVANTIGPSMNQVFRRIMQICDVQDLYFDGTKLPGMPSTWQYIQEFIKPGKQITTRATGVKQFMLAYAGFKNMLTPLPKMGNLIPSSLTKEYDLGTPITPFVYGTDPIPSIQLYSNPRVQFVMQGGKPPPIAIGIYHKRQNKLDLPPVQERDKLIKSLLQPNPARP